MQFKTFTTLALALSAIAAPASIPVTEPRSIIPRAVINHDAVVAFPETIPADNIGRVYKRFQPWLRTVGDGCWSYPAVDKDGNTGGGLKTSGSPHGGCRGSSGQIYVRSAWYNGKYAIMYTWYMPKDQGTGGLGIIGHRHEWESVVVWIDNMDSASPAMLGISASAHSGYNRYNYIPEGLMQPGTNRPFIKYYQDVAFFGTHSLDVDTEIGGEQPMIQWEMLPEVSRNALATTDFGDANFPQKEDRFWSQLEKAYPF